MVSVASHPAVSRRPDARWRPGQGLSVRHGEIFAGSDTAAGAGLALSLALDGLRLHNAAQGADQRPVLWVQDQAVIRLTGRPYCHGLPQDMRHRVIHVATRRPEDALFALEEGLRCRDLACVIGEVAGNPRALDFTASRRLSLVAQRHGVPLWLVRLDAARDLSSARMRWAVEAAPSLPPRWNPAAPGAPSWHAELFRSRFHIPGEWILRDDGHSLCAQPSPPATTPDHGDLAGAAGGGSLAA